MAQGQIIENFHGELTIKHSSITDNWADTDDGGAGIANISGKVKIIDSTLSFNLNGHGGGGYGDSEDPLGMVPELVIKNSTISGNSSGNAYGGGIVCHGKVTIIDSSITDNRGEGGAGILILNNCEATIRRSEISNNEASMHSGGGILSYGKLKIIDSSIANNMTVSGNGGGIFHSGYYGGHATIIDSSIANNSAAFSGGGIYAYGTIILKKTIVEDNTPDDYYEEP